MDLDLPELQAESEAAGGALSGLLGILDRLPGVVSSAGAGMVALAARTVGVGASFDSSANRLRLVNGQFAAAGSVATTTAQQLAQKIPAALSQVGQAAGAVGGVITKTLSGDVRGALSQIGGWAEAGIGKLQEKLAAMGPYGAAAAAALGVFESAAKATIGTVLDMAATAIKLTETRGAFTAAFSALAGGEAAGAGVISMLGRLNLPFASSQTRKWAESLLAAGTSASQLEGRVKAVASAEALMRDVGGGGAAAESLFKKLGEGGEAADAFMAKIKKGGKGLLAVDAELHQMGLSLKDFGGQAAVAKMSSAQFLAQAQKLLTMKGGGALEEMAGTWDVIKIKAAEGLSSIFSGLTGAKGPVASFMASVKSLFGEFSKGGVGIKVLKPIVTEVFSTLFRWGKLAVDTIHKGFLMLVIGALTAYIAMRPAIDAVKKFVTSATFLQGLKFVLIGIAIVAGLIALPFVLAGAAVLLFVAAVAVIGGAVIEAVGLVAELVQAIPGALSSMADSANEAASNFVAGLLQGISAGAGAVVDAVKSLASGALSAFTGALGIKSPSRIMLEHGEENIAGAAATGIDKGGAKVDDAMARLGGEPPKGGTGKKGKASAEGRGPVEINFSGCTFFGTSEDKIRTTVRMVWEEMDAEAPVK